MKPLSDSEYRIMADRFSPVGRLIEGNQSLFLEPMLSPGLLNSRYTLREAHGGRHDDISM
ncbi:hypothetical protein C8R48DRAFT_713282 [Suillus tomentosus]|nr:hypothetical protein C8R48DRAFT_713282 [Suillus tomentosus]